MRMAFDQRQLRAFLAVAELGSLGRAVEIVHMSQPALSRLIQEMEIRLGSRLFDRLARGMMLTDFGEALVPYARKLLYEMDQAILALGAVRGLRTGMARVGAVATAARGLLPEAVEQMLRTAPGLRVLLTEGETEQLLLELNRYDLDLVIAGPAPASEAYEVVGECLIDSALRVFCSAEHELASKQDAGLEDVLAQSWVMLPKGTDDRDYFDSKIQALGLPLPEVAVETNSASTAISFVDRTRLLGWLPRPLFAGAERVGRFRVIDIAQLERSERLYVYKRRHDDMRLAAKCLFDHIC